MGSNGQAVILLILLGLTGLALTFNIPNNFGIDLGIGFNNINGLMSGIMIILVKLVGIALAGLCGYIIYGIIRG